MRKKCLSKLLAFSIILCFSALFLMYYYYSIKAYPIINQESEIIFPQIVPINNDTLSTNKTTHVRNTTHRIDFIHSLKNLQTNKTINCSIYTFKYIQILLKQLWIHKITKKWTTNSITDYLAHKRNRFPHRFKNKPQRIINGRLFRMQISNGSLVYQYNGAIGHYRKEWFASYFNKLLKRYAQQIPNTDIVLYVGDGGSIQFDWEIFPFWTGDGSKLNDNRLPLYLVSRAYFYLREYATNNNMKYIHQYMENVSNDELKKEFMNKSNIALFRGSMTGKDDVRDWRKSNRASLIMTVNEKNFKFRDIFDCKFIDTNNMRALVRMVGVENSAHFLSYDEQMKYKFVISIDGNSVRDGFILNLMSNSVVFKQKSVFNEFWYFNLVDDYHYILWNDTQELIQKVVEIKQKLIDDEKEENDILFQIASNGRRFIDEYMVDDKVDCYIAHMLQVYNYFFFDEF